MKNLKEDIKNNNFKPYYLLYGDESYLLNYFKNEFKKNFSDNNEFNIITIDNNEISDDTIINNIVKMPLFADKKLIIIENLRLSGKGIEEALRRAKDINVVLYIIHDETYKEKYNKKNEVTELFEDEGYICELSRQDDNTLISFVKSKLKEENKIITDSNASYLINRIGNDLYNIDGELKKLVSFLGGRQEIAKEDIDKVTRESIEEEAFNMINYLNQNNMPKAYEILGKLKSDPHFSSMQLFGALKYNYVTVLKLKALLKRELSTKDIMNMLNIKSKYYFEKLKDIAKSNTIEYFKEKVEKIYDSNKKFMTGQIKDEVMVELMIS